MKTLLIIILCVLSPLILLCYLTFGFFYRFIYGNILKVIKKSKLKQSHAVVVDKNGKQIAKIAQGKRS